MEGLSTQSRTLVNINDVEIENDDEVYDLPLYNRDDYIATNLIYMRDASLADV